MQALTVHLLQLPLRTFVIIRPFSKVLFSGFMGYLWSNNLYLWFIAATLGDFALPKIGRFSKIQLALIQQLHVDPLRDTDWPCQDQ